MKKIIVAGAGHGGLVAAADLAEKGFDVTVIEKEKRENLGHDWEDRFNFALLDEIIGVKESELPEGSWRYRGDCAFVSPAKRARVVINFAPDQRQKIMWRKELIKLLLDRADRCGVNFIFETEITSPVIEKGAVVGVNTDKGEYRAPLVIDSLGAFSSLRLNLPDSFGIEKEPKEGQLFYARRMYYNKLEGFEEKKEPFEVYMRHNGEKGLSWCCTNDKTVDILIGRTYKLTEEKINESVSSFRADHPYIGESILHGGTNAVIPVRRPLTVMVADGYCAAGDSAFMTMPMNGMGIDLSLKAGRILSDCILKHPDDFDKKEALWEYNRTFHIECGAFASKNDGLKTAILNMPAEGVDFLFENGVIQARDLAGGGANMKFGDLVKKFANGMKKPGYFFAVVKGLIKGAKASKMYKNPPEKYDAAQVKKWSDAINS